MPSDYNRDDDDRYMLERRHERADINYYICDILERSPVKPIEKIETEIKDRDVRDEKKSSKKEKKHKKHKKRSRRDENDSSSEDEDRAGPSHPDDKKFKKKKKKHHKKRKHSSDSSSSDTSSDERDKKSEKNKKSRKHPSEIDGVEYVERIIELNENDDGNHVIGPMPEVTVVNELTYKDYGKALLPGEGAAMAAYIADGKRIPRRGEIGLKPEEIQSYEDVGFVMSGSRHRRMEAVRLRKENQIYTADEKRALSQFNQEERNKRETHLTAYFKNMIKEKTKNK